MAEGATGFGNVARALSIPNYRIYTIGNLISLSGTWIQRVAVGWLAWQLTHSGAWLGLCAAADLIPVVVVSPFAGALADRTDRLRLIWLTQIVAMSQAVLLAVLTYTGLITVELLFAMTLFLGVANAMNQPARLALIPSLVDASTLGSAVALNSLVFNAARFIGPATAGIVIAQSSVELAFALNALSYPAFIFALSRIHIPADAKAARPPGGHFLRDSFEGYVYALTHRGIGGIVVLFSVTSITLRGFIELFPGFADRVFGRGPMGLAGLTATVGLGAMVGCVWMLRRSGTRGLTRLIVAYTLTMSLAVLGFTLTDNYALALVCVFVAGFAMVATGISAQTLIQIAVDPAMRGRVLGFYGMIFRAGPAVNAVAMGVLSGHLGLRVPVAAGACLSLLAWGWARLHQTRMALALERESEAHAAAE